MAENRGPHGGGGRIPAKPKNFKASMAKLIRYLKDYGVLIIISLVLAAAGTVFSIVGPKILIKINEEIIKSIPGINNFFPQSINFELIGQIGIFLIVLYIVSAVFNYVQHYIMAGITARVSKQLRRDISEKINRLPLSYFDSRHFGDVLSRITNDVDTISQSLSQSLSTLVSSLASIIGIVIMMFTIAWDLTLITLVSLPLSFFLIGFVIKFSQKHFVAQQSALGALNGHIEEIYSAHNVVKVFNGEQKALETFDKSNTVIAESTRKAQFLSGLMMPIMNIVGNLSYVLICVIGGAKAITNPLFIASIVSFISYVRQFNQPIAQIANVASTLQSTAAASERVFEFLEEAEQEDETFKHAKIDNFKGSVEFKDVVFGYLPEKEIIHGFSCKVEPGQKVAIVGPTGAGKTTMINLLMRFYEVNSGDILIDGVPTKEMKRGRVRALFGMVLQDAWLFEGTIRENLCFGRDNVSQEELETACKAAKIHHFITTLPGGYDMVLDENSNLSQGQRQLITIARAMIQNAPMLILDEATSSVDTRTEVLIQEAMDELMKGRTSFVIAHRLSTIKNADIILVMKDGNIIETGNHDALMQQQGFYHDLYNSQFSSEEAV